MEEDFKADETLRLKSDKAAGAALGRERAVWICGFATAVLVCLLAGHVSRLEAESARPQRGRILATRDVQAAAPLVTSHIAIADFDGDLQPDVATVESGSVAESRASYRIRFELSTGAGQSIGVTAAAGGLQIWTQDVNGDNFPDLMISTKWLHEPVAILLNDGHGKFIVAAPSAFPQAKWDNEKSWKPARNEGSAGLEIIAPKNQAGELEENGEKRQPEPAREFVCAAEAKSAALFLKLSGLERAPPA